MRAWGRANYIFRLAKSLDALCSRSSESYSGSELTLSVVSYTISGRGVPKRECAGTHSLTGLRHKTELLGATLGLRPQITGVTLRLRPDLTETTPRTYCGTDYGAYSGPTSGTYSGTNYGGYSGATSGTYSGSNYGGYSGTDYGAYSGGYVLNLLWH